MKSPAATRENDANDVIKIDAAANRQASMTASNDRGPQVRCLGQTPRSGSRFRGESDENHEPDLGEDIESGPMMRTPMVAASWHHARSG